jgi:hypothetical protein
MTVLDRSFVGRKFPAFRVILPTDLGRAFRELLRPGRSEADASSLPWNWPAILTGHGTAGLIHVWEELAVDPTGVRLLSEEFVHFHEPLGGVEVIGLMEIEDIAATVEPQAGIEDQADFRVDFRDLEDRLLATYRFSCRVPTAGTQG